MKTLLLLHGAVGSKVQLKGVMDDLEKDYIIHAVNLPGHGGISLPEHFSIPYFAEWVKTYLDQNNMTQVSVFGYSMGGYVAMYLAKQYPSLIEKVITLGTKFEWNAAIAAKEVKMLQPDVMEQKVPAFAQALAQRHMPMDWKQVVVKTQGMLTELGNSNVLNLIDYADIQTPALLLLGDRDKMVSLEETVAVYKQLPNAQLGLLPHTSHPIEGVDVLLLTFHIRRFIG